MRNLRNPLLLGTAAGAAVGITAAVTRAYRNDTETAWQRLDAVNRKHVVTPFGTVEYAEAAGTGEPVLVSHGIFHGCDGGLLSVRDVLVGRRVIAPSRFGYLGSDLPPGATPEGQADAFAALLDHLRVSSVDVVSISAGTTAALQFALRHPDRTRHLVVLSGNFPGDATAAAPPGWAKLLYADLPMWAMRHLARPKLERLMGVPAGFPHTVAQLHTIDEMLDSIFPVGPRAKGAIFDAYVSNPAVHDVPIEKLTVPTMIIHAKDDPLCGFAPAEEASHRIRGCTLVAQESGGHLGLGHVHHTRAALDRFLTAAVAA